MDSDGKRNMPSGEIFTSPLNHQVKGHVHFDVPSLVFGEKLFKDLPSILKMGILLNGKAMHPSG